jgi:hypothetical protein
MLNLNYNIIGAAKQKGEVGSFAPYIYPDPYSGSIVAAIPGTVFKAGYTNLFDVEDPWEDISSYVKGNGTPIGSDRTVTASGTIVSASTTVWDRYGYPSSMQMATDASLNAGTDALGFSGFNITTGSGFTVNANANWCMETWIAIPVSSSFDGPNRNFIRKEDSYQTRLFSGMNNGLPSKIWVSPGNTAYTGSVTASLLFDSFGTTPGEPRATLQTNFGQGAPTSGSNDMPAYTWHHVAFSGESNYNGRGYPMYRAFFDGRMLWQEPVDTELEPDIFPYFRPASQAILFQGGAGTDTIFVNDFRFYNGTNKNYTSSFDVNEVYPIVVARPY